jgi:OPA family sugar phosphate sensor protein UhpC-like MFS transporter
MGTPPRLFGPDRKYERWRWQIFAITWLAYVGFYLTRKSFAVAKIEIGKPTGLGMTDAQMSAVDGAFLMTYALGQFLWGACGDRFGPRKVVSLGMLGSVVAAVAMGSASFAIPLVIFSAIQGLCQATGWSPLAKNVGTFFSRSERGTVMGLWLTNYAVGGLIGSVYAGYVGGLWGWRYAFWVPAATLAFILLLFLLLQRNKPEDIGLRPIDMYHREEEPVLKAPESSGTHPALSSEGERENSSQSESSSKRFSHPGSWRATLAVIRSPMVLLLSLVYFFMKPTRYAIMFWSPKYLSEQLHSGMAQSGFLSALFELAGPASVFLAGVLSDRIFGSRRNPICVVCLMGSGIMLFLFDKLPHTPWVLGGCLFLLGLLLFPPDSLVSGTAAIDFGTREGAATAAGLINGCGSIGAILGGSLPGILHQKWGWGGVFACLATSLVIAGLLLLPQWNALPKDGKSKL